MSTVLEAALEICVGTSELIPVGEGRTVRVGGEEVAVFRGRDGGLHAVQSRCPHRGAPLAEGLEGGGQVVCPYHSYRFDLESGACLNEPSCRLDTYPIREADGLLLVTLEGKNETGAR